MKNYCSWKSQVQNDEFDLRLRNAFINRNIIQKQYITK